jgi:hypothetical protein
MGSDFQERARGRARNVLTDKFALCPQVDGCSSNGVEVDAATQKIYAWIAIAVTICLRNEENFDGMAPVHPFFNVWGHDGVAKGQRCGLDVIFLTVVLGGLASLLVSIIIRPVRRQNVVPTHWVRK